MILVHERWKHAVDRSGRSLQARRPAEIPAADVDDSSIGGPLHLFVFGSPLKNRTESRESGGGGAAHVPQGSCGAPPDVAGAVMQCGGQRGQRSTAVPAHLPEGYGGAPADGVIDLLHRDEKPGNCCRANPPERRGSFAAEKRIMFRETPDQGGNCGIVRPPDFTEAHCSPLPRRKRRMPVPQDGDQTVHITPRRPALRGGGDNGNQEDAHSCSSES